MPKRKRVLSGFARKLLCLLFMIGVILPFIPTMVAFATEFANAGGTTYIGTIGSGNNLTFANGVGYKIYQNYTDNGIEDDTAFSGAGVVSDTDFSFYIAPDEHYGYWSVELRDEKTDALITPKSVEEKATHTKITVAANDMTADRRIKVTVHTAVSAHGGIITSASEAEDVAAMFDASYIKTGLNESNITITNNVTVQKGDGEVLVVVTNNILLKSTITASSGVTLTIVSSGDYTIKRYSPKSFTGNLLVGDSGSTINLGSGFVSNDTVTYFYSDGSVVTKEITGTVEEPTNDERTANGVSPTAYIISAMSNASVSGTMNGTLTIDGGAVYGEYTERNTIGYNQYRQPLNTNEVSPETNDLSLVQINSSVLNMWSNVTLENNNSYNEELDSKNGGGAVHINGSGQFYMYGGLIQNCINRGYARGAVQTALQSE